MRKAISRLRNRFTIPATASVVLGSGSALITSFLPNTPWLTPVRAGILVDAGIGLLGIGLVVGILGIIKTPVPVAIRLYDVVPLLKKSMARLWDLAYQEAKNPIDWDRYQKANEKINTDIIGVKIVKPRGIKHAKTLAVDIEAKLRKKCENLSSFEDLLQFLQGQSVYLDLSGFGLKKQRENDTILQDLTRKIAEIRDMQVDSKLNNLIRQHIDFAEYSANAILAQRRSMRVKSDNNLSIVDLFSTQVHIEQELLEKDMTEIGYMMRTGIFEQIRKLEYSDRKEI